jgi:hypothetical protein
VRVLTAAGVFGPGDLELTVDTCASVEALRKSATRASSGSSGRVVQVAARCNAARAAIACSSRRATTPRNRPSRTTATTLGTPFTAVSSNAVRWAAAPRGRTAFRARAYPAHRLRRP